MCQLLTDTGDDSSPVLCLITRPEDELPIESTMQQRSIEQFTLKIDTNGNIINVNAQGLRNMYASNLTKDTPKTIMDLCHIQDIPRLEAHINEVKQLSLAMSSPYRLRLGGPDKYVHVKANSRLFRGQRESEFIMTVNTILSDNEVVTLETMSSNTTLSLPGTSHSSSFGMGGPLMTSVINGNGTMVPFKAARANSSVSSFSSPPTDNLYSDSFDFPFTDSFDINGIDAVGGGWDHRPDSRTSVTPVSTPRPPSVPAFSPAASICPSPLTSYHSNAGQPSPSNNNNNNNNINNNNTSGYNSYSYLSFDDKDSVKDQTRPNSQIGNIKEAPQIDQAQMVSSLLFV